MRLARRLQITAASSALVLFEDGTLGYATFRFDRYPGLQIHVEDFCQALGINQDEAGKNKFQGSIRDIAKVLSGNRELLLLPYKHFTKELAMRTICSLIVGNHDAHLKNYSLVYMVQGGSYGINLSPAYDILPLNALASTAANRESALMINHKNRNISVKDLTLEFASFSADRELLEALTQLLDQSDMIVDYYLKNLSAFGLENYHQSIEKFLSTRVKFLKNSASHLK